MNDILDQKRKKKTEINRRKKQKKKMRKRRKAEFKVMYANLDFGMKTKKDELLQRVSEQKPDIIALNEIIMKTDKDYCEAELTIPNYDMFINKNPARGVALYFDSNLNAHECEELNDENFKESVWCSFTTPSEGKILIGCIYRSPNTSDKNNDDLLFEILQSDKVKKYDKVMIVGDFNYPNITFDGSFQGGTIGEEIRQKIEDAFMVQKVTEPTRRRENQRPTRDDWILTNDEDFVYNIQHLDPMGKSDHDTLLFGLDIVRSKVCKVSNYIYSLKKGNYDDFRQYVRDVDWSNQDDDVENRWNKIKKVIHDGMTKFIPTRKQNTKKRVQPIWMNKKALRIIKKKHKMFKRFLKSKNGQNYQLYVKERNLCTKILKQTRRAYEKGVASEGKKNPKKFWRYVQDRMKSKSGIGTLKTKDGSLITNDKDKAETLNEFFSSVFTNENKNNIPNLAPGEYSNGAFLSEIIVTPKAVEKKLHELNPDKAQGPDKIPPKVLKELSKELAVPLSCLFNLSLQTGQLPSDWKKAEVTAIFKKGSKLEPGNYRPVSLTCVICKVMESFIRDGIVNHFKDNKLYADCQHGFRQSRSCVTQLLQVMESFTKYFDDGIPIDVLYLDFRKAFDSVPHERLLRKLEAYGIAKNVLNWTRSFLSSRTQKVRVGAEMSSEAPVVSGIPQGSILGPILFTAFINDMPDSLESSCYILADDTKIFNDAHKKRTIQEDIYKLQQWSETWDLHFNVSKCHVMHMGTNNPKNEYFMKISESVQKIEWCEEEKDLGVTFDPKLKFDTHIHRIVAKANKMLGIIKRSFMSLNKDCFMKLYKAFVRPHLEYANVIWAPHLKRQSIYIENVQRRATRLLKPCNEMSYDERLKYLNLHSLKGRRDRGDLIQIYKIYNGIDDVNFHSLFSPATSSLTRNSEGKILMRHCNTNLRKFYFSNRIISNWNSLPYNVKNANTLNDFKIFIDRDTKLGDSFYGYD